MGVRLARGARGSQPRNWWQVDSVLVGSCQVSVMKLYGPPKHVKAKSACILLIEWYNYTHTSKVVTIDTSENYTEHGRLELAFYGLSRHFFRYIRQPTKLPSYVACNTACGYVSVHSVPRYLYHTVQYHVSDHRASSGSDAGGGHSRRMSVKRSPQQHTGRAALG